MFLLLTDLVLWAVYKMTNLSKSWQNVPKHVLENAPKNVLENVPENVLENVPVNFQDVPENVSIEEYLEVISRVLEIKFRGFF